MKDIKEMVRNIVTDLENGIEISQEDIDSGYVEDHYEDGDIMSGYDYISDVLDINYILNSDKTYKGARILVAFGGPNIWIDTNLMQVEGYWWGDTCILSYSNDAMGLDESLNELFEC